jgi:hypothetical protein
MAPKKMKKRNLPFLLMILSALLIVLGINLGEVSAVVDKAIKICLSCMGIG